MAELRENGPYIWITWLTKLLTGEHSCEWAAWFKAHHEARSWEKMPDPFDQTRWLMEHTARVVEVREQWEADGYRVFTEGQNAFALRGRSATLGGKPDLVAVKDGEGAIIDIKTGQPYPSHAAQVMLYMYAVPKALGRHGGIAFTGSVVYPGHSVEIPASAVDAGGSWRTWGGWCAAWRRSPRPGGCRARQSAGTVPSPGRTARSGWTGGRGGRGH